MYLILCRIIGALLIACGLIVAGVGVGILVYEGADGLAGTMAALLFGSVFAYVGYRFVRTRDEASGDQLPSPASARLCPSRKWHSWLFVLALAGFAMSSVQLISDLLHSVWLPQAVGWVLFITLAALNVAARPLLVEPGLGQRLRRNWRTVAHSAIWVLLLSLVAWMAVSSRGPLGGHFDQGALGALCLVFAYAAEAVLLGSPRGRPRLS